MREVDQDAEPVAGTDQLASQGGEAGSGVGRTIEVEGNALAERVSTAPDRTERTHSSSVKHLQCIEIIVDRLRPFNVQQGSEDAILETAFDRDRVVYYAYLSRRFTLDAKKPGHEV